LCVLQLKQSTSFLHLPDDGWVLIRHHRTSLR